MQVASYEGKVVSRHMQSVWCSVCPLCLHFAPTVRLFEHAG